MGTSSFQAAGPKIRYSAGQLPGYRAACEPSQAEGNYDLQIP